MAAVHANYEALKIEKIVARATTARRRELCSHAPGPKDGNTLLALAPHVLAALGNESQPGIVRQMPLGVETRRARRIAGSKPRREADCDNAERDEEQIPVHDNLLAGSCNYPHGTQEKDMVPKRLIDISLPSAINALVCLRQGPTIIVTSQPSVRWWPLSSVLRVGRYALLDMAGLSLRAQPTRSVDKLISIQTPLHAPENAQKFPFCRSLH